MEWRVPLFERQLFDGIDSRSQAASENAACLQRRAQELHLAAMEQLERDLSRNEKNASRALKEQLQEARAARAATCVLTMAGHCPFLPVKFVACENPLTCSQSHRSENRGQSHEGGHLCWIGKILAEVVNAPVCTATRVFCPLSNRLRNKESLYASDAAKRARSELEDAEEKAQLALVRNLRLPSFRKCSLIGPAPLACFQ